MPAPIPGEVWLIDLGMVAKVRPCLILTPYPADDELAPVTVVAHTTSLRGNKCEIEIPKPFLVRGAFHIQQISSPPVSKLERRLGMLTSDEFFRVREAVRARLGI